MKNWIIKNLRFGNSLSLSFLFVGFATAILSSNNVAATGYPLSQSVDIWHTLGIITRILTWNIGIIAVIAMIIASIIYTTSNGNYKKIKLARFIVLATAIGIVLHILLYIIMIVQTWGMPSADCP